MNPIAEGSFWRIMCVTRALLKQSGIPNTFWPYAFMLAIWILNRTPRFLNAKQQKELKVPSKWVTSYELVTKRKPNLAHLRIFGCRAYTIIDKPQREGKLGDIAYEGWHLGLCRENVHGLYMCPRYRK